MSSKSLFEQVAEMEAGLQRLGRKVFKLEAERSMLSDRLDYSRDHAEKLTQERDEFQQLANDYGIDRERGSVSADGLDDAANDLWVTEGALIAQYNRNLKKWATLEPETRDRYRAMAAAALKAVDVALDSEIEAANDHP